MKAPTRKQRRRDVPPSSVLPPSSLISFSEPPPSGDDRVVRVVFDDRPIWPPHPVRSAADQVRRWGFYPSHATAGDEVPNDVEYRFDTVEAATTGALQYLEPYWSDDSTLVIHNGVVVPNMPANAVITGSPGYRRRIDAGVYGLELTQLRERHSQTERQASAQARLTAVNYEIPSGQHVDAFYWLWERLPRRSRPKLNDWFDEMMPRVGKRTRQRHLKIFRIVSSEDWPIILATTEVEITGMESILRAARAFSPRPPPARTKTPLRERYLALRDLVFRRQYEEARRLVQKFDEEDANVPEGGYNDEEKE